LGQNRSALSLAEANVYEELDASGEVTARRQQGDKISA